MRIRLTCVLAACALTSPVICAAQDWPTKPLRFIVPFAAGGSTDQVARILGERLSATLGQQIIIDNRGGGNGVLGTALAAKSSPDGYNYLVVFDSHATNPSLQKNLPYNTVKDFTPITLIASSPMALVVHAAAPYQNLADLIAAAKAKPGELILGSGGIGSRGHLAVASLERRAGFKVTQVPYRGTSLITTDLLGRQITMQMGTVFFVAPYVKAQRLRALAVTVASRVEQLPDVPTVAEQGYPGYDVNSWWGMLAPAGVPKPMLQQLNAKLREVYASPVMRERLAQVGLTERASNAEQFTRFIAAEMDFWGKVVRESNITASE
jgi:tripartite-type tricarboxylate transporter receptor subunit TctC